MEDAEIPLAQLRLLKLRTRNSSGSSLQVNLKKVDEVYGDMGGLGRTLGSTVSAGPPAKATAVAPSIRFDAVIQYSAEESDLTVATVLNISDSFLLRRSAEARESLEDPAPSARHGSNLELDQREQLEDLSAWRRQLMTTVLPT